MDIKNYDIERKWSARASNYNISHRNRQKPLRNIETTKAHASKTEEWAGSGSIFREQLLILAIFVAVQICYRMLKVFLYH